MRKKRLVNKKKSIVWMMIITLLFTVQSMPQRVKAAEQTVGNMVIMVTFEKDDNGNNLTDEFADGYEQTGKYYCWNQKSGKGSEAGVSCFKDIYTKETGSLPPLYQHDIGWKSAGELLFSTGGQCGEGDNDQT